jgi:RimJ/RimL family protein N-acetyltransferase
MTFYSILFGSLLLAAVREVLRSLNQPDWSHLWEATTLALLIISDVLYTSHIVEDRKKPYLVTLKFLDLFSFFVLCMAIFALNPTDKGYFGVAVADRYKFLDGTAVFWCLIVVYWGALVLWNFRCDAYRYVPKGTQWWWQPVLGAPLLVMALAAVIAPGSTFARAFSLLVTACVAAYLGLYKHHVLNALSGVMPKTRKLQVALNELTPTDEAEIQNWPPYPPQFMALDYALRSKPGWLAAFPANPANHRFAARKDGKLVGFSILTETGPQEAEFYVAIHPEKLNIGIGIDVTRQTKERGFDQLNLRHIWLKVRTWHEGAIRVYERVGFRKVDPEFTETAGGREDRFIKMEVFSN